MAAEHRVHLAPPPRVVEAAKSVMGAIDFDHWSNKEINRLVNAAKIFDRDKLDLDTVLAKEWVLPGEKRAFIAPAHGAQWTRRLANKALREYRKGGIDQALLDVVIRGLHPIQNTGALLFLRRAGHLPTD